MTTQNHEIVFAKGSAEPNLLELCRAKQESLKVIFLRNGKRADRGNTLAIFFPPLRFGQKLPFRFSPGSPSETLRKEQKGKR